MGSVLITPSKLISELVIVHLKIWHQEEIAHDENASDKEIVIAKKRINILNNLRTQLENEIDENFIKWLGGEIYKYFPNIKDYKKGGKNDYNR